MRELCRFMIALQFLSTLPVRLKNTPDPEYSAGALLYYPLVGLLIGMLLSIFARITYGLPGNLQASLVLAAWVLLTGGLHLDGLADSVDAWVGGLGDREKTLTIMKDPCCGPAGVVALLLVLLTKFSALEAVLGRHSWESLILAPTLARTALVLLFRTTPYVRPNGLGSSIAAHLDRRAATIAIVLAATLLTWFFRDDAIRSLLVCAAGFCVMRRLMLRRIGGTTGDTAGMLVEVSETLVLFAVL